MDRLGLTKSSEGLVRSLTAHVPVGVFVTNAAGETTYVNERANELTGLTEEQSMGSDWTAAVHPDDAERVTSEWAEATGAGEDFALAFRFLHSDDTVAWVEASASAIRDLNGVLLGWTGVCVDVTKRMLSEERYHELFENARDAVYTADEAGHFLSANRAAEELTGFKRAELLAMNFFDLVAPEHAERARHDLARSFAGHVDSGAELQLVAKNGQRVFVEITGRIVEEDGRPTRIEGIARNTTERHTMQEQLMQQAFHDDLTGLPNRVLFLDRLGQALARAGRTGVEAVAMILDLDNFKLVNDSLGHDVGDELLAAIGLRLSAMMRGSDTVARLGGDEFAFVVESVRNDSDLIALAREILSSFEEPFVVGTRAMGITASLGIAVGSQRESADIILRNADTAMYKAKATRRGGFELFDDEMRRRVLRELEVRNKLAEAVQNHELQVYYQPIVSLANGRPLAIEALVRWLDPQCGWVPPDEFIPLAEGDGLIVQLGRSVLAETVRQTALWRNDYPHLLPLGVFVNVSPRELAEPDFISFLVKALADEGLTPSQFGIEITERVFIDERDDAIVKNVRELGAMGVRLSLDDFGTGYSALASIKRFPFTALKIDRFFIRSIRRSTDVAPISNAVVSLGKALGLTVIAEGVETSLQADYLCRLGCDAAQGHYYARPQPAEQLSAYLAAIACPPDTARLGRTPAAA